MEFPKEFIEEQKLTEEQVTAISGQVTNHITNQTAELKKEYDGKANTDFEGIANGAAKSIFENLNIERENGEKIADFISRAAKKHNETMLSEAEAAKNDYLEKSKNVKGNEGFVKEFEALKIKYDDSQKKHADYDTIKETSDKYGKLSEDYTRMESEVSYAQVKPNFPETVNKYEADTKWKEFKVKLEETHNVKLVDGVAKAIDKINIHKIVNLSDIVAKDSVLTELMQGRQQNGMNSKVSETTDIEGVPFKVPVDITTEERAALIDKYLTTDKKLQPSTNEYSKLFKELYTKIIAQKKAA